MIQPRPHLTGHGYSKLEKVFICSDRIQKTKQLRMGMAKWFLENRKSHTLSVKTCVPPFLVMSFLVEGWSHLHPYIVVISYHSIINHLLNDNTTKCYVAFFLVSVRIRLYIYIYRPIFHMCNGGTHTTITHTVRPNTTMVLDVWITSYRTYVIW